MLAPRVIPPKYAEWNRRWGAPMGRPRYGWPFRGTRFDVRRRGPFAWQGNNSTREFEYPWAFDRIAQKGNGKGKNLTVVDIGGSLGGMQFVLAKTGHRVINVDPGLRAGGLGWEVDPVTHQWLCQRLGASVEIVSKTLAEANLPARTADVILSISSLEHFSDDDLWSTAEYIPTLLKDDGLVVMTVDCFLDVQPFTGQPANKWGRNVSIADFLRRAELALSDGIDSELMGFDGFSPERVLSNLSQYYVGSSYPCLAQCFTAGKAAGRGVN
jgi:hypothetical protein